MRNSYISETRLLESLPSCFIKDYDYGLGFTTDFRFIVHAVVELTDYTEIEITASRKTGVDRDGKTFCISSKDLDNVRKTINRTIRNSQAAAQSVNYVKRDVESIRRTGVEA